MLKFGLTDYLLNLDLQFSLGVSFRIEDGLLVFGQHGIQQSLFGSLPSIPSGRWFSMSSGTPYFADAV